MEKEKLDLYVTIIGLNNYRGNKVFKIGSIVKLIKEPENYYDTEAIACEMKYIGKVGYIANSITTVIKGTMSAGRVYDKITDPTFAEVKFIDSSSVIAEILNDEEIEAIEQDYKNDDFYN